MNVLRWLSDAGWGNAVAMVALVVAVWQVARTEGMQPPEAVEVQVQRRTMKRGRRILITLLPWTRAPFLELSPD